MSCVFGQSQQCTLAIERIFLTGRKGWKGTCRKAKHLVQVDQRIAMSLCQSCIFMYIMLYNICLERCCFWTCSFLPQCLAPSIWVLVEFYNFISCFFFSMHATFEAVTWRATLPYSQSIHKSLGAWHLLIEKKHTPHSIRFPLGGLLPLTVAEV